MRKTTSLLRTAALATRAAKTVLLNATAPGAATPAFAAQAGQATEIGPEQLVLADMDRDGMLDAVVATDNNTINVLVGPGDGTFGVTLVAAAVGNTPDRLAVGVFNQAGRPDVVTANLGDDTASVVLNTP